MINDDVDYLTRRADEELAAAAKASNPVAAQVHREMAERFRARAAEVQLFRPPIQ